MARFNDFGLVNILTQDYFCPKINHSPGIVGYPGIM